jgi:hypothetical protein
MRAGFQVPQEGKNLNSEILKYRKREREVNHRWNRMDADEGLGKGPKIESGLSYRGTEGDTAHSNG